MFDHAKPTLQDDKPDYVILHTGTNDLWSEKTSSQVSKSITEIPVPRKSDENSIIVSAIVLWKPDCLHLWT